jgi:WD40 repeat protein/DNA-binding SARP family transcriptional activator
MATAATTGLRFSLLGPLEVRRDGQPLALGGERQRGLLALLLLHANELVTTEHLAEQLFGAEASDASVRAVRVAVSRLRRLLDDETLETGPGGYLVRADPDQLDVAEFDGLVAEGRAALDRGDPAAAAAAFQSALALFRGPPLTDLAQLDFVQPEIRRLEELRLSALMDRIDADLALGSGSPLVPELEALVQTNPFQERLRGQLMLALYRSGRQADALEVYRQTRELLADELGLEPSRALQQLERAMLQHDPALEGAAPVVVLDEAATCPFKGLAAFEAADAFYFCGRELMLDEIVTRLASGTFLGIVGPSGVGKSSLLRAGILPALAAGALPGSATWPVVLVRGSDLAGSAVRDAVGACGVGERVVIAVDQLEEIFADEVPAGERSEFFDQLEAAATDTASRALVLVAVRADFFGRFADHPRMADRLSQAQIFARPLDQDEIARAIEVPASRAGLEVEPALVDALVSETAGAVGALPLLQTTLLQLWGARAGRVLTYESYRAMGGVRGAVGRLAEETFGKLSPEDQALTRRIMLRLAAGEDGALVRRRVPLVDLQRLDGAPRVVEALVAARLLTVDDELVELSHEALLHEWPRYAQWLEDDRVGRRVRAHLTAGAEDWDCRGRDSADLYRGARLTAALELPAADLSDLEREFLDASRAETERELDKQRSHNRRLRTLLIGAAVLLVAAVVAGVFALVSRSTAQREAQVALGRQLGAEAVSTPRLDLAMLLARESLKLDDSPQTEGTLLATLLRSPAAVATFTVPITVRPCCALSVSPEGSILGIPDNGSHLRLVDVRNRKTLHVYSPAGFLSPPAFTPDGSKFAFLSVSGPRPVVDVADTRTMSVRRKLPADRFFLAHEGEASNPNVSLFFTPDGKTLLYVYNLTPPAPATAAYVDRWDVAGGKLRSAPVGADGAQSAALVDHGRELAVVGTSDVTFLDTRTLRVLRHVPVSQAEFGSNATAVSPDGATLALGLENGSVTFVNLHNGRRATGQGGHSAPVQGLGYSPNGAELVSTADDGSIIVWDVRTRTPVQRLYGHAGRVLGIAFSSDGRTLFTSSLDGAIFEWDLGTHRRFGRSFTTLPRTPQLGPDAQPTTPLAISPDGSRFAARAGDRFVGIYATATGEQIAGIGPNREVIALAWSSRGVLSVDGARGLHELYRVPRRNPPRLLRTLPGLRSINGQPEAVLTTAFSPDGSLVAAGDVNHTPGQTPWRYGSTAVWNVRSGKRLWLRRGKDGEITSVAFSPDGTTLAAGREDGAVLIYDVATGRLRRTLHLLGGGGFSFETLAFAPDGTLATGTWGGIVQLWNPNIGKQIGQATQVAAAPVASLSFSRDGETFATAGGSDGLAKLWTTATQQQFGATFPGDPGQWGNAQYTPDGSHLIVVYQDGKAFVWPTSLKEWEDHACSVAGRNFKPEEWRRFVGSRGYSRVCR